MIHIENIKKSYNGVAVLHIPALHVEAGESVGLVGNNGAGKTTLLTLMLDLIQPDCGTIALGEFRLPKTMLGSVLRFPLSMRAF